MNVGSLYLVKKWYWLLFSSKEISIDAAFASAAVTAAAATTLTATLDAAAYYSKRYKETVTYFSPDSHIVFLEEDGKVKKVLTSDGLVGWTWFDEDYFNSCFEEVKTE